MFEEVKQLGSWLYHEEERGFYEGAQSSRGAEIVVTKSLYM